MIMKRPSLTWTVFLIFLLTTQIQDSEALATLKLKKLLKKVLLLKALSPSKAVTIVPLPIPLELLMKLLMKDKMEEEMKMMPADMMMPMSSMAMSSMPMSMMGGMMGGMTPYDMMMMPKAQMKMPPAMVEKGSKYGMM